MSRATTIGAPPRTGDGVAAPGGVEELRHLASLAIQHALTAGRDTYGTGTVSREDMRLVCDRAHALGLHIEEVIVMLKELWRSLSAAEPLTHTDALATMDALVTRCIREFYRDFSQAHAPQPDEL